MTKKCVVCGNKFRARGPKKACDELCMKIIRLINARVQFTKRHPIIISKCQVCGRIYPKKGNQLIACSTPCSAIWASISSIRYAERQKNSKSYLARMLCCETEFLNNKALLDLKTTTIQLKRLAWAQQKGNSENKENSTDNSNRTSQRAT